MSTLLSSVFLLKLNSDSVDNQLVQSKHYYAAGMHIRYLLAPSVRLVHLLFCRDTTYGFVWILGSHYSNQMSL